MNIIDTIYFTGDLIAEKTCKCNDALPIIIKQTTEPCCENTKEIVGMLCNAMVPIVLIVVVGWLIWKIVSQYQKNKTSENERKFKERESLMKQRQDYQVRILDEFPSYKKICDFIEDEKRKIEKKKKEQEKKVQQAKEKAVSFVDVVDMLTKIENMIAEGENGDSICQKVDGFVKEEKGKIEERQKEQNEDTDVIGKLLQKIEGISKDYTDKLTKYTKELDGRIVILNNELGIKSDDN